jgi:RHS repeat-associated protein
LSRLRYEQKTLGGAAYVSAYAYDTDGSRSSMTYPLELFLPPNNIARYSYSYDPAGNVTAIQDAMDSTYSRTFGYDDLNRLVTANTGTSLWGSGNYAYDAMGNLTSRSLGNPPVDNGTVLSLPGRHLRANTAVTGQVDRLSFTFQGATPKISVVTSNGLDHTLSYDAAGNETGYFASRAYSSRNLMTTVTDTSAEGPAHQITYGYDYRGVRVSRTETPTDAGSASRYFFYTPELQLLSSTVDDSNNVWGQSAHILAAPLTMNREVVWFAGQPVAEYGPPRTPDAVTPLSTHRTLDTNTPANNLFYTFTDHLGTPLIQTDPTTAIVWRAEHEPYGNVYLMRKGARTDQPLRFPGQEVAMTWEGAEENYNIFRWYGAGWGRYTQADPIGLGGGLALFSYSNGNALSNSDPNGLSTVMGSPHHVSRYPLKSQLPPVCNGQLSCTDFAHDFYKNSHLTWVCVGCGTRWHPQFSAVISYDMYLSSEGAFKGDPWHQKHEQSHIDDVVGSVKAWLDSLEEDEYVSQYYCDEGAKLALTQFYHQVKDAAVASEAARH